MVTVTEGARQELKRQLSANVSEPELGLRLTPADTPGQFVLVPDEQREGDQVVEHEGSKVLLVDEGLSRALQGVTIDCQDTAEGLRLVLLKK